MPAPPRAASSSGDKPIEDLAYPESCGELDNFHEERAVLIPPPRKLDFTAENILQPRPPCFPVKSIQQVDEVMTVTSDRITQDRPLIFTQLGRHSQVAEQHHPGRGRFLGENLATHLIERTPGRLLGRRRWKLLVVPTHPGLQLGEPE